MVGKKLTELNACSAPSGADLVVVESNVAGNSQTLKCTLSNLFGNTTANVVIYYGTPANSTITVKQGTVFVDSTYLYVATANDTLKRITLETF